MKTPAFATAALACAVLGFERPVLAQETCVVSADSNLDQVARELVERIGGNITYDDAIATELKGLRCGLLTDLELAAPELRGVAEQLLALHGFALTQVGPEELGVLVLHAENEPPEGQPGVSVENAGMHADSAALRVSLVESCEHLDARQMTASLRPWLPLSGTNIAPLGEALVLDGPGCDVHDLARLLGALDPTAPIEFPRPAEVQIFQAPDSGLEVAAGASLLSLLESYESAIGSRIAVSAAARAGLAQIVASDEALGLEPNDVHAGVSRMLFEHGFSTSILGAGEHGLIAIHAGDDTHGRRGIPVAATEAADLEALPALYLTAVVDTGGLDARRAAISMRALFAEATPPPLVSAALGQRLLMRGRAGDLAPCMDSLSAALSDSGAEVEDH